MQACETYPPVKIPKACRSSVRTQRCTVFTLGATYETRSASCLPDRTRAAQQLERLFVQEVSRSSDQAIGDHAKAKRKPPQGGLKPGTHRTDGLTTSNKAKRSTMPKHKLHKPRRTGPSDPLANRKVLLTRQKPTLSRNNKIYEGVSFL